MYKNNSQAIELKAAITAIISEIPKKECVRVIDNFSRLMQVCLQRRGGHLERILEKTWPLCKGTSMTETLGNDYTQTVV